MINLVMQHSKMVLEVKVELEALADLTSMISILEIYLVIYLVDHLVLVEVNLKTEHQKVLIRLLR